MSTLIENPGQMNAPAIAEEIRLESDDRPIEERGEKVRYINRELRQEDTGKGLSHRFAVFNDTFLYISLKKRGKNLRRFQISLAYLEPKPRHHKLLPLGWLKAAVVLALLAFAVWFAPLQTYFPLIGNMPLVVGTGLFTLAIILVMAMVYSSYNNLVFFTEGGQVPLVFMSNNKPNKTEFREFCAYLEEQINYARQTSSQIGDKRTASLIRIHRHLRDEGVIDGKLYDQAKQRLLGLSDRLSD